MKSINVNKGGITVITVVQVILCLAALGCFIYACTWDAEFEGLRGTFFTSSASCFIAALLLIPFKKIVKAAEYVIGVIECEYSIDPDENTNTSNQE